MQVATFTGAVDRRPAAARRIRSHRGLFLRGVLLAAAFALLISPRAQAASLTLLWDPPIDSMASGYVVLAADSPGVYSSRIDVGPVLEYKVNGLAPGTRYCFAVAAYDDDGFLSEPSEEVCATTGGSSGAGPSELSARVSGSTVGLTWVPPAEHAVVGHRIEVGNAPGRSNLATLIVGAAGDFRASQVPAGTYFVRVIALTQQGDTAPSNEVTLTVGASQLCGSPPPTPTNLRATIAGDRVTLDWDAGQGCEASSYTVYAGTAPGERNVATATVPSPSISARAPAGTYYVFVVAQNASGGSARSTVLAVTIGPR